MLFFVDPPCAFLRKKTQFDSLFTSKKNGAAPVLIPYPLPYMRKLGFFFFTNNHALVENSFLSVDIQSVLAIALSASNVISRDDVHTRN